MYMPDRTVEPWNPRQVLDITPEQYEEQVIKWLQIAGTDSCELFVTHKESVSGAGGEYELDGRVEFEILGGAKISVLVECKKHQRPIDRDTVLGIHAKMMALRFQKAIIFSTIGFQRGAIEYANTVGVALVVFVDGRAIYHTRSVEPALVPTVPPWVPSFAGQMLTTSGNGVHVSTVYNNRTEPLTEWLRQN
jgi:restriction system protein